MMPHDPPRWCTCEGCGARPHVENCDLCMGFGHVDGVPVSAGEHPHPKATACARCGGPYPLRRPQIP